MIVGIDTSCLPAAPDFLSDKRMFAECLATF